MVCAPDNVMSAVVPATTEALVSKPCATVSTYDLLAMSVAADGVVATVPAVTTRLVIVPRLVSEEAVTPEASVAPDRVPAGAMTAAVVVLVVKPLALIVMTGIAVLEPVEPAEATVASVVALPTDVTSPVKLALVVTVPAVSPEAVPVMFVPSKKLGVPRSGVTSVGLLDSTTFVVPVEVVTPVPPLATTKVPATVTLPVVEVDGVRPVEPKEMELTPEPLTIEPHAPLAYPSKLAVVVLYRRLPLLDVPR